MPINETQLPKRFKDIIDFELATFPKPISVTERNAVPETSQIPIQNPTAWVRVKDIICVFVDMKGSTQLSATHHRNGTAAVYRFFTQTAVSLFSEFDAAYIDVKGDGAFAIFNADEAHRALAAAVTFQTFAKEEFTPGVKRKTKLDVGYHIGIDQKTVLVRKIGMKMVGRTDRQNEVWAGKTVNMAAKLGSRADSEIWVSDRFYSSLKSPVATHSCGCNGGPKPLWEPIDVSDDDRFDFDKAYSLKASWCVNHGRQSCETLLQAG